jgi:hypothetical protein
MIADHDHVRDPGAVSLASLSFASGATPAQAAREFAAELASALDKEGLVDRLVAHPHHRIVRELLAQAHRYLFGRPPCVVSLGLVNLR